jgi:hypothetical protein
MLEMIAKQESDRLELRLGLHGGTDKDEADAEGMMREHNLEGSAASVPAEVPLGALLNHLAASADGELLLKWDDDDLYGPMHIRDLIAAHRHSRAPLVGKAAEFTHFTREDVTVLRYPEGAETMSPVVAGGTLLIERDALELVGGFPPITRSVDHYLKQRFARCGLDVFRTHGFGFVLVRHGEDHTWHMDEPRFRSTAVTKWAGVPSVACV